MGVLSKSIFILVFQTAPIRIRKIYLSKPINLKNDSLLKTGMADYFIDEYFAAKYPNEVQSLRAPFSLLMQHIEYIIQLVGVDYVGLGSDFDGIEAPPTLLDDVTTYPLITKALLEKGHSKKDITKILGGNILRVLKANGG